MNINLGYEEFLCGMFIGYKTNSYMKFDELIKNGVGPG